MNRILQKFVGDTSPSSSSQRRTGNNAPRTPASTGGMSNGSSWVGNHFGGQAQAPSYPYQQQPQQEQYYGQQQPVSDGGGYGYHNQQYQQHQGYMATNSQGHYLEEIPLSSPQSNSKPNAATLFEDASHSNQQQSYFGYGVYAGQPQPPQQQYQGACEQQYPAAADSFFQSSHGASSESSPALSRSASADLFAQPPRSTTSSHSAGGFNHFHETVADPSASTTSASLAFATTTPTKASSHNGFDQQYSQQQASASLSRSVSGTASDLFANPPPSTTPSFDGFDQQYQQFGENSSSAAVFGAAEASSRPSSADLFANATPVAAATSSFYDGFAQQQQSDPNDGWGSATSEDLFVSAAPGGAIESSTPSPFNGFSQQHQQTQDDYYTTSAAAPISAGEESVNPFASSGASAADPFANPPGSATNSSHHNNGFSQQSDAAFAESADPFASSAHSFAHSDNGFEQQHQQQSDAAFESAVPFASSAHSLASSNNGFEQQQYQQEQQQQQYYDYNNQEASPFVNSTSSASDYHHADPFASQQSEFGYANYFQSEQVDPFAQQPHSSDFGGYQGQTPHDAEPFAHQPQLSAFGEYQVQAHNTPAAPVTLSPTQVNDFFSETSPNANNLFSSESAEAVAIAADSPFKSPQPSPITPTKAEEGHQNGLSFSPGKPISSSEPTFEPVAIPTTPVAATPTKENSSITSSSKSTKEETDPVTADENDPVVEEITLKLKKSTLDDSHKLVEMYKHMAERLEGEKNELLKVLADQADQFYQMQEYIASLEQELEAHRSNGKKANQ